MIEIYNDDCLNVLKDMEDNSVDSIVTDPPYGLSFMGKKWDYDVPSEDIWKECLRVLKPGGTALIFAGSRTQHRMAVRVEDSGFILKDTIMWVYGSGFPKALDISKKIDKMAGVKHPVNVVVSDNRSMNGPNYTRKTMAVETDEAKLWDGWKSHALKPSYEPIICAQKPYIEYENYDLIIEELLWQLLEKYEKMDMFNSQEMESIVLNIATLWNNILDANLTQENRFIISTTTGLITELKTLRYLIYANTQVFTTEEKMKQLGSLLSVKIVEKSLTDEKKNTNDILKHIAHEIATLNQNENTTFVDIVEKSSLLTILNNLNIALKNVITAIEKEREVHNEPILVCMKPNDGGYADNALKHGVAGFNIAGSRVGVEGGEGRFPANLIHDGSDEVLEEFPDDNARYFKQCDWAEEDVKQCIYIPKASKSEKNEGLDGFEDKIGGGLSGTKDQSLLTGSGNIRNNITKNSHPTVKPVSLMEYLCTLTKTPTGGIVLDPFMGSGSTGIGAISAGRDFIGVEMSEEYYDIANARIGYKIESLEE